MKRFSLLTLFFVFAVQFAWGADESSFHVGPDEVLSIRVIGSVSDGFQLGGNEHYRFRKIQSILREALQESAFPAAYEIKRFGNRSSKSQPRIDITIMRWGQTKIGDIEARFMATYRRGDMKTKLGIYRYSDSGFSFAGGRRDEIYDKVMEKAVAKLVKQLKEQLAAEEAAPQTASGQGSSGG